MVQKKGKYGIRSGTSFRFGSALSFYQRHRAEQYQVRKLFENRHIQPAKSNFYNDTIQRMVDNSIDDGIIGYTHDVQRRYYYDQSITYSLNKRKRWLLENIVGLYIDELREYPPSGYPLSGATDPAYNIILAKRETAPSADRWYYNAGALKNDYTSYNDSSQLDACFPNQKYAFVTDLRQNGKSAGKQNSKKKDRRRKYHNLHFRGIQRKTKVTVVKDEEEHRQQLWEQRRYEEKGSCPSVIYEICTPRRLLPLPNARATSRAIHNDRGYYKSDPMYSRKSLPKIKGFRNKFTLFTHRKSELKTITHNWNGDHNEDTMYKPYQTCIMRVERVPRRKAINKNKIKRKDKANGKSDNQPKYVVHKPDVFGDNVLEEASESEFDRAQNLTCSVSLSDILNKCEAKRKCSRKHKSHRKKGASLGCDREKCISHNLASSQSTYVFPKNSYVYDNTWEDTARKGYCTGVFVRPPTPTEWYSDINPPTSDIPNTTSQSNGKYPPREIELRAQNETIEPKMLEASFDEHYTEAHCYPRRFVIKCVDRDVLVLVTVLNRLPGKVCELDEWEVLDEGFSEVRLVLYGNTDSTDKIMQKLMAEFKPVICHDFMDIMETVMETYTVLGTHVSVRKGKIAKSARRTNVDVVKAPAILKWDVRLHSKEEAIGLVRDQPVVGLKPHFHSKSRSATCVHPPTDDLYCDICFDVIVDKGTSLKSCLHWFCDACWKNHLQERFNMGDISIECPGYECDKIVDHITLLSILHYDVYTTHLTRVDEAKLSRNTEWQWCPSSKCTALAHYPGQTGENQAINVRCMCSKWWCFVCSEPAHFPCPCDIAELYNKVVQQQGDDGQKYQEEQFFVDVKKCPTCRYPMEKNGGCQHMTCKCGESFCWECLAPWQYHIANGLMCDKSKQNTKRFLLVDGDPIYHHTREDLYQKAVQYRRKRNTWSRAKKRKSIENVTKAFMIKQRNYGTKRYRRSRPDRIQHENYQLLEPVGDCLNYFIEVLGYTEHCYALFCQITRRLVKKTVPQETLQTLELLLDSFEQTLSFNKDANPQEIIRRFDKLHKWINLALPKLDRSIKTLITASRNSPKPTYNYPNTQVHDSKTTNNHTNGANSVEDLLQNF